MRTKIPTNRRRRARAAPRPAESQVYSGDTLLGDIIEHGRTFSALSAEGRQLGKFASLREAMAALRESGRQTAPASGTP